MSRDFLKDRSPKQILAVLKVRGEPDIKVKLLETVRALMEMKSCFRAVQGAVARLIAISASGSREEGSKDPTATHLNMLRYLMFLSLMEETRKAVENEELTGMVPFCLKELKGITVTQGRLSKGIFKVLGVRKLPILMSSSPLSRLLMIQAHQEDHSAAKQTLWRTRSQAWIVRGKKLAREVERDCPVLHEQKEHCCGAEVGRQRARDPSRLSSLDISLPGPDGPGCRNTMSL